MNEFRIRETGAVVSEREFRSMHSGTSFPDFLTVEILNDFGADPVLAAPQPALTEHQSAFRNGVVQDSLGNWVYAWAVSDWARETIDAYEAKKAVHRREAAKAERARAVEAITVTVNNKVFDGDETSQTRMARAIMVSEIAGLLETTWTLADNTVATVTVDELKQALAAAGQAQAALWQI